jgi:hydroxyacylglutathione hydrolase
MDLSNLPAVPPYWPRMREMNRGGPPRLGVLPEPPPLGVDELEKMRRTDAVVVDCRTPEAFSAHIPGAFNVGLGPYFATWAGTVLPYDAPLILVLERTEDLWDACWQLLRIGYELPKGWLAGGMLAWRTAGMPIDVLAQWTVWDLRRRLASERDLLVLDVRQPAEWAEGHILGAVHITGAEITQRADDIPRERPVAAICGSGYRSSVAASVLQRRGHGKVFNVCLVV